MSRIQIYFPLINILILLYRFFALTGLPEKYNAVKPTQFMLSGIVIIIVIFGVTKIFQIYNKKITIIVTWLLTAFFILLISQSYSDTGGLVVYAYPILMLLIIIIIAILEGIFKHKEEFLIKTEHNLGNNQIRTNDTEGKNIGNNKGEEISIISPEGEKNQSNDILNIILTIIFYMPVFGILNFNQVFGRNGYPRDLNSDAINNAIYSMLNRMDFLVCFGSLFFGIITYYIYKKISKKFPNKIIIILVIFLFIIFFGLELRQQL